MRARWTLAALAFAPCAWSDPPPTVLWAWERPEDLRALAPNVGVAFFHSLVTISPAGVHTTRRRQPLRLAAGAWRMPVVHIEVARNTLPQGTLDELAALTRAVTEALQSEGARGVQVDFDAPRSWRATYLSLLRAVRASVGPTVFVSMTALASWCLDDAWLDATSGSVDEVVPMVFTMGRGGAEVLDRLRSARRFARPICQRSVGWAEGEPTVTLVPRPRTYVFNPSPWRAAQWARWVR